MPSPLDRIGLASLPEAALSVLADLRREPGIAVRVDGGRAWVWWEPGTEGVLRRVLPVPGVELYEGRDGLWYRHGRALPTFALPGEEDGAIPLDRALVPSPVQPVMPDGSAPTPARLALVRDDRARPASALRGTLAELGRWAELATSAALAGLEGAREGDRVLLLGRTLPGLRGAERFWGERVLSPLGFRPEPALPEAALRSALGVEEDDLVVIGAEGVELVPRDAFRPLSRAGVRLALGAEGRPT